MTQADSKYKDDGTPIPADEVFLDLHKGHWKPFLKGLTLLPKEQE